MIGQKYESCWCEEMANIGEIISDQYWEVDSPSKIIVGRFCENKNIKEQSDDYDDDHGDAGNDDR